MVAGVHTLPWDSFHRHRDQQAKEGTVCDVMMSCDMHVCE